MRTLGFFAKLSVAINCSPIHSLIRLRHVSRPELLIFRANKSFVGAVGEQKDCSKIAVQTSLN